MGRGWDGGSCRKSTAIARGLERGGHVPLRPAVGVECLEKAAGAPDRVGWRMPSDLGAFDVRWAMILGRLSRPQAVLLRMQCIVDKEKKEEIKEEEEEEEEVKKNKKKDASQKQSQVSQRRVGSALAAALAKRSEGEAQRVAVDVVTSVVRGVLGVEGEVDVDRPLTDAGMDSLLQLS